MWQLCPWSWLRICGTDKHAAASLIAGTPDVAFDYILHNFLVLFKEYDLFFVVVLYLFILNHLCRYYTVSCLNCTTLITYILKWSISVEHF